MNNYADLIRGLMGKEIPPYWYPPLPAIGNQFSHTNWNKFNPRPSVNIEDYRWIPNDDRDSIWQPDFYNTTPGVPSES